jgi:hypothetical protein
LPEDHLARFIIDAVKQFDLTEFMGAYRSDGVGQASFHPAPVKRTKRPLRAEGYPRI